MTTKTLASAEHARRSTPSRPAKRRDWSGLSLCISPALMLIVWELCTRSGWVSPQLLPAPSAIFLRVLELAAQADFWHNLGMTIYRLLSGLLIACVVGVSLALTAQLTRWSSFLLDALIRLLAPIPKIALYPALILIMGFESSSKIALVVSDAIFPVLMASWVAAQTVDRKLIWSARAAGTSRSACL